MRRIRIAVAVILFLCHPSGPLQAAENLRAASGGFTTAIHAVLWAAYEEKIFKKYGLDVEYLALNTGRLGMQMLLKKYIRVNEDEAAIGYDYYLAKHGEGILELPDRRGLAFVIQETAKSNPKAAGQTPETLRLLEPSVLDEIKKSGFVERVKH